MSADLLDRKASTFVLWRPMKTSTPPQLIIGQFQAGNPPTLVGERQLPMRCSAAFPDLWELPATECGLQNGQIYHYLFEIDDSDPGKSPPSRIRCADPTALTVDWRLRGPVLPAPYTDDDRDPASVIRFQNGRLAPLRSWRGGRQFRGRSCLDVPPAQ
jgi:pullulanase